MEDSTSTSHPSTAPPFTTSTNEGHQGHIGDQYEVPAYEPHSSFTALKQRIRHHYDLASDYYYSLWGQHIHHAYFLAPTDTQETGQVNLINLLLDISKLEQGRTVLDVGCGIGGTTRHLAREHGCSVTGITISGRQVQIARRLTREEASKLHISSSSPPSLTMNAALSANTEGGPDVGPNADVDANGFTPLGVRGGKVQYFELDAENMEAHFPAGVFDCVWISEALSHFPDKVLFFHNAARVLRDGGGKLVIADWFKNERLTEEALVRDIRPIEDGMLLPPLCTPAEYVSLAEAAGLKILHEPKDISQDVAKTW
ncbi:uncharacterized protein Z518_03050 [Rhinocladiella mackenziei CBS 650.93]|uniref:Methyltransferase type 11 domain-containing protein n=1 Tax=Rhinocladiella mackenziei CBS 650.93 TaxID=1442369 RepID=A0A0D2IQZ2_9EURO|nr:uncharacterized protein Z518_03050 [Rhinocladiella mackenziei CBS 650.93]KIX08394.1 hypothetical protein Z518_03050 [Rhinocladiella mackenziei CBS 650.93]